MNTNLFVTHTIGGLYAEHGGPSRSVPGLCDALADHLMVSLVTGAPASLQGSLRLPKRAQALVVPEPPVLGRVLAMRRFERTLIRHVRERGVHLIHDHGLWLPSNHVAARVARDCGIPSIVSPRGMLSAWALQYRSLKKRLAWYAYQRADLWSASAFHATSDKEAEEIRALGFAQPIAVLPNGLEMRDVSAVASKPVGPRIALFMSRLHPKKGVADLITAWAECRPADWALWIAGPDDGGYRAELERQVADCGIGEMVRFCGEADDAEKGQLMRRSSLFVLPSYDENYGIVVAEALAAGLPVITTTATPWQHIATMGAGWIASPGPVALADALNQACALDASALARKGAIGLAWAQQHLGWPAIARQMAEVYEWLLGKSDRRPECVRP